MMNGLDFLYLSGRSWQIAVAEEQEMWFAASEVIWRRSWQMLTGRMSSGEATRMILEKPLAFARAAQLATEAVASGADPGGITRAAVLPLHAEVHHNAQRLRG